jgi:hypothetical protein
VSPRRNILEMSTHDRRGWRIRWGRLKPFVCVTCLYVLSITFANPQAGFCSAMNSGNTARRSVPTGAFQVNPNGLQTGNTQPTNIWTEVYAATYPGATCGDKIISAYTAWASSSPGLMIDVNAACGFGTPFMPWTSVSLLNFVGLKFLDFGAYFVQGITVHTSGIILGLPATTGTGSAAPAVVIKQGYGNNANAVLQCGDGTNSGNNCVVQDVSR